jgi:hypothetical protein
VEQGKGETAGEPGALQTAVRRARAEQAERSDVTAELRGAEIARLEMLFEAFKPILAQAPAEIDLFDAGLSYGERPRLFIDMICYVEMAHDRRLYRLVQETRHGRMTLAEAERIEPMVEAMTDYVARRLVERQIALASAAAGPRPHLPAPAPAVESHAPAQVAAPPAPEMLAPARRSRGAGFFTALLFVIELLGSIVLFVLLAGAAYLAWRAGEAWWVSQFSKMT